ncbi:MAG: bifunctional nuclease family protein [Acidobacteria bacterium]|nr:bifunctional nuclease family protein [Acidobacteriota bacterium]
MIRSNRLPGRAARTVLALLAIQGQGATAATLDPGPGPAAGPVPVHIAGISQTGPDQVLLILADESEQKAVPIAVGRDQGLAIYLGKTRTETARPMTHDLLAAILGVLGAEVEKITVTGLKEDVYFAEISLRADGKVHPIDARPSDAIALAVRLNAQMFSAPALLKTLDGSDPGRTIHAERRLGLTVQELDRDLAASLGAGEIRGVLVASVAKGGPADRAGLRRGDILQALDGHPVPHLAEFRGTVAREVKSFTIWREGNTRTLARP